MPPAKPVAPRSERDFDAAYYGACYYEFLAEDADPLIHYQRQGWKDGLNPNAFFSTSHYLASNPDALRARTDPFTLFKKAADDIAPYASPIFDAAFYLKMNPELSSRAKAIEHYWKEGRNQGRSPNVLFDLPFYRSQLTNSREVLDCLSHYLETGWRTGLSPHPLFDPEYYQAQLSDMARSIPPLAHYLETGWKEGLSPHPLFDPAYYIQNASEPVDGPPLVHYLMRERWDSTPHYLFSDAYYVTAVNKSGLKGTPLEYRSGAPLLHYCEVGASNEIPFHPLFDLAHYKTQVERLVRNSGQCGPATLAVERDPLRHYCTIGIGLGISPTRLFEPEFYRALWSNPIEGDPLAHYLSTGFSTTSPHPAIDLDHYARHNRDFAAHDLPVILDLLMTPKEARISTHPAFDPEFYLQRNPEVGEGGGCPVQHFIEYGLKEARQPNALFTYPYAQRLCKPTHPRFWNPVDGYFRSFGNKRPRVLFLSHDASQSGAPLVLLGLVKQISAVNDIECITILGAGGPLVEDFVHASLTYVVSDRDTSFLEWTRHSPAFNAEMSAIVRLLRDNPPELIVCNSLESRHLADFLVSNGFGPLVTLVHEVADPYSSAQISRLLGASELSFFVSQYQLGRMRKKIAFDESKSAVVQFGALNSWFGSGDREVARHDVLAELGLAEGARIVLACGTMNFRKGIDVFAEVACTVLERTSDKDDVHFLWVGGGETHYDSAFYWAEKLVRDRGFDTNVHFVGERFQTEKYFLAADLFILTSRADPFPCVVQEAMACSLPIVAFQGTSGAAEAVDDSGVIVPFGAAAMATAVEDLLADQFGRIKRAKRAREILQTKNTTYSYTNEIFGHVRACAPKIADLILARSDPTARSGTQGATVLVAVRSWDFSESSLYAQHVVRQLNASGVEAELLFTRGPSVLNRSDKPIPLPEVPFSFLYPKSQQDDHVREEIVRHLTSERNACVFAPYSDDASFEVLPELPAHIATMAIVHGENQRHIERVYALSRHLDRIVCTSADVRQELIENNPQLKNHISVISPEPSGETDPRETAAQPRETRSPADEIRILCSSFDTGEYGRSVSFVKLANLLREEQVDAILDVLVNDTEARAIRAVAPDLTGSGILHLIESPSWTETRSALAGADLFFFDSAEGSTALIVAEAMALGCVPITRVSRQPVLSALKDGKNSHLLESGNLRNVARIIRDHQRAPERLRKMSRAARRAFSENLPGETRTGAAYAEACRSAFEARAHKRKQLRLIGRGVTDMRRAG